jgi:hypothetical protein
MLNTSCSHRVRRGLVAGGGLLIVVAAGLSVPDAAADAAESTDPARSQPGSAFIQHVADDRFVLFDGTMAIDDEGRRELTGRDFTSAQQAASAATADGVDAWTFPARGTAGRITFDGECLIGEGLVWRSSASSWTPYGHLFFFPCDAATAEQRTWRMGDDGSIQRVADAVFDGRAPDRPDASVYLQAADSTSRMSWGATAAPGVASVAEGAGAEVENGGLAASTAPTTQLDRASPVRVPAMVEVQAQVTSLTGEFEFTAPEGTSFTRGQSVPVGYRPDASGWQLGPHPEDVEVSADGSTLTAHFRSVGNIDLEAGALLRVLPELRVDAGAPGAAVALRGAFRGDTEHGAFAIDTTSAVAIPSAAAVGAPAATGVFPTDVTKWAEIIGTADVGATVVARTPEGTQIASTQVSNADGSYELAIDPSKVGAGDVDLLVTQTVGEDVSTATGVRLSYGQNTPRFSFPTEGSTVLFSELSLRGTGNRGGVISVSGTDFSNDLGLGSTSVDDDLRWSVDTAAGVVLPSGPYQLWVSQRTKGGKVAFSGVNVTVRQQVPSAPTASGIFPADVAEWASVVGVAQHAATVTVRDADRTVVGSTVATAKDGAYEVAVDPTKVGSGLVDLFVTSTSGGATSEPTEVRLDYGDDSVAFTGTEDGATISGDGLSLSGSGVSGGLVQLNGTDFSQDTAIGSARVVDGAWTVTNTSLRLPEGPYQLWAAQRTKGGKIGFAGINVIVAPSSDLPAPRGEGYFPERVDEWAGIGGLGRVGATVIAKDADGVVVGSTRVTDPSGTFNIGIDPTRVGSGLVRLTVSQSLEGTESPGTAVTLDYGDAGEFAFQTPSDGSIVRGDGALTFTGSASDDSSIRVTGTDFATDSVFGEAVVSGGRWTVTAGVDLPSGAYQFWATARTKGGKLHFTAVNVTVER